MARNIGFVSTRFAGTDGVTLEASKWAYVLKGMGHRTYWFAGEVDRSPEKSMLVPEAFFHHPDNQWISERIFGKKGRPPEVTDAIDGLKKRLKSALRAFIDQFGIELIIAQNCLTIPMHLPLGMALTEIIAETQIPTIAHHHDFYWERVRFTVTNVGDYLRMAFPPNLPGIAHVVINSAAQEELALRTGISSTIIPNVIDFETPPPGGNECRISVRDRIGLQPGDTFFLQPTRVVARKGIEHAIELVKSLDDPRCKLVISHEAGDEGYDYVEWLREDALRSGVNLLFLETADADPWRPASGEEKDCLSLWDIYPHADFITYPSLYEGFGNAFLEAVYFQKPLLINRYATFVRDIEPLGFDLVVMDGYLTRRNVEQVREVLTSADRRQQMVSQNFDIARRHYSYAVLRRQLNTLMTNFFGMEN